VYSLGYFGHVLYQYNVVTGRVQSVVVGSVDGHISRNFLCDHRGHAYVPRLRRMRGESEVRVTLVEFDPRLKEVGETELRFYSREAPTPSHGIVAFQPLADRSIVFATNCGYLYRIVPRDQGPATVSELGWFHPAGDAYVATLFTYTGEQFVVGVGKRAPEDASRYEWIVFDLETNRSRAMPIDAADPVHRAFYVYGSVARDNQGNFYVAGGGPNSAVLLTPALERAVLAVGGVEEDLAALREVATPYDGPALFRVESIRDTK